MTKVDWLDVATKCFTASQTKELHVDDMAKHALQSSLVSGLVEEDVAARLSAALSGSVKRSESQFSRIKNDSGGYRRGFYRIKTPRTTRLVRGEAPAVVTGFTGKAGEHAVLSELIFRGYNASIMVVDQGIDIVASKNNKYFHIQVKTANGDDSKPYTATVRREVFQHAADTFYVVVLRRAKKQRYINDFLVLSSRDIIQYIRSGQLKDGPNISLRIVVDRDKFLLNGTLDITHLINFFDSVC